MSIAYSSPDLLSFYELTAGLEIKSQISGDDSCPTIYFIFKVNNMLWKRDSNFWVIFKQNCNLCFWEVFLKDEKHVIRR